MVSSLMDLIMDMFGLDEGQKEAAVENSTDGGWGGIATSAGRKGHGQSALKNAQDMSKPQLGGLLQLSQLAPKKKQRQPLPTTMQGLLGGYGFGG